MGNVTEPILATKATSRFFVCLPFWVLVFFLFLSPQSPRLRPQISPVPGSTAPRLPVGKTTHSTLPPRFTRFRGPRLYSWNFAHSDDFVTPAVSLPRPSSRTLSGTFVTARPLSDIFAPVNSLNAYGLIFTLCVFGHFWVSPVVHKKYIF